ncbi:MAG: MFS transporter [Proteobacteria bacterium]|nr:MFS transporter [Pseudomonadota bacterium]
MGLVGRASARSLAAIIGMVTVVGLTWGLTGPLLNLILENKGISGRMIGFNGAMTGLGALFITPFVPRLVSRWGAMPLIFVSLGGSAVALLALKAIDSFAVWFLIRFLLGMAIVILFVVSEVWINQIADDSNRGRLLGIYAACLSAGFGGGPVLVEFLGTEGWAPFLAGTSLIVLAGLVITFVGSGRPEFEQEKPTPFLKYLKASPIPLIGGIIYGAVETGVFGLMPVFGVRSGFDKSTSALFLTAVAAGNIVLQYPVGWLVDQIPPIRVLWGCATVGILGGIALPLLATSPLIWPLLFIWGGTITGIYTVSLTMLGHQYKGLALTGANAALIAAYNLGTLGGLPFLGQAMDLINPGGLGYGLALIFFLFFIFSVTRGTGSKGAT